VKGEKNMSLKGQAMTDKVLRGKITNIRQIEDVNALYAEVEKVVERANKEAEYAKAEGMKAGQNARVAEGMAERAMEAAEAAERAIAELDAIAQSYLGRISTIFLASSAWQGAENLYSQEVSIAGVTANSKIDINPSIEQLAAFHEKDIAFVAVNEDGIVTVYCVGQKPLADYEMQITITEVR
jgi:hypothetical protein